MTNAEIIQSLGTRMRELRGGHTITVMAARAGVTYNTWWRYEAGRVNPSLEMLGTIADALGVKVCLFEEDEAA